MEQTTFNSDPMSGLPANIWDVSFTFVDLFAGIGGFHGALSALGGHCVYASEIDQNAAKIYLRNWGINPHGDITYHANEFRMDVPDHDVLVAGFPCQPFSKSGKQLGMEETRGTLFWNIAEVIRVRKPKLVLLENVRNLAGPRHSFDWDVIIRTLRELGYRVSEVPFVVSPHKIHPINGGTPQIRERIFICATHIPSMTEAQETEPGVPNVETFYAGWRPEEWNLAKHLPLESNLRSNVVKEYRISEQEEIWLDAWGEFVDFFRSQYPNEKLPGFPMWADAWITEESLEIPKGTPDWEEGFLRKNARFYDGHRKMINMWLKRWNYLEDFPPSRRKFEWQARDEKALSGTLVQFRPSGIRCKPASYAPALVAITQTSVLPGKKRKLTIREVARLQGFPDWFDFLDQSKTSTYRQLGNAVNLGVVYNVLKAQVLRDLDLLTEETQLVRAILTSPMNPQDLLKNFGMSTESRIENALAVPALRILRQVG